MDVLMRRLTLVAATAGLGIGLVACGDEQQAPGVSAAAAKATAQAALPATIAVTIGDPIRGRHSIKLDRAETRSGRATFGITNVGGIEHEFVIFKTNLPVQALPHNGGKVPEKGIGTVVTEAGGIKAGATVRLRADLRPGTYALICNLPKHYENGMYAALSVG
jgi:uncharacterized cupredoxin-like copper-binding protein